MLLLVSTSSYPKLSPSLSRLTLEVLATNGQEKLPMLVLHVIAAPLYESVVGSFHCSSTSGNASVMNCGMVPKSRRRRHDV